MKISCKSMIDSQKIIPTNSSAKNRQYSSKI